ncbi:hypothetical protein [Roseiconus lacunae]|nr:hypothetical protein [Roseiconus lacunae]
MNLNRSIQNDRVMETKHSNGHSLVQVTDANNLVITSLAKLDHIV